MTRSLVGQVEILLDVHKNNNEDREMIVNLYNKNFDFVISFKEEESLPKIKTTTSKIYDYALGKSKEIPLKHLCLPIWYGLDESICTKVLEELKN